MAEIPVFFLFCILFRLVYYIDLCEQLFLLCWVDNEHSCPCQTWSINLEAYLRTKQFTHTTIIQYKSPPEYKGITNDFTVWT